MEEVFQLLIPITAILIGGMMFLIPIAGLTARFAIKPIVEMWLRAREQIAGSSAAPLEQRLVKLDERLSRLEDHLERLAEQREFDRQIAGPGA